MHDLEAIRRYCKKRLGDGAEVFTSARDHGAAEGIAILTPDGWRSAYLLNRCSTAEEVADFFETALAARGYIALEVKRANS